jgi:PPM family protein phosphatase
VGEGATMVGVPAVSVVPAPPVEDGAGNGGARVLAPPQPPPKRRMPRPAPAPSGRGSDGRFRRRMRRAGALVVALVVLGLIASAAYLALQSVYFIGTNGRGLVTLYQGVPYKLPGNVALYSSQYVSGVGASTLSAEKRRTLLDHSLRSESDAASLIRSLELGQLE